MTNNDVSQGRPESDDQRIRDALGRYAGRFEPMRRQWSAIDARQAAGRRPRNPWWKIAPVAVVAAFGALAVIVVNLAPINIDIGQSRAQAKGAPAAPQYNAVTPPPAFPAGSTMAIIRTRGFIRVGVKTDQPGFGVKDPVTGAWSGFDIEIAKLMAIGIFGDDVSRLGNRILFIPVVSKDREAYLQAGTVDLVIATYSITAARQQVIDFAGPYLRARQDIMVKSANNAISDVSDLNGRKVCTVRGSTSYQHLIAAAPNAQVMLLDTYSACAQALGAGKVEAVSTDDAILAGLVKESAFAFKEVNKPFSDEDYGIGLKKGDSEFRAFLTSRLLTIEANGDWALAHTFALENIQTFSPPPIAR